MKSISFKSFLLLLPCLLTACGGVDSSESTQLGFLVNDLEFQGGVRLRAASALSLKPVRTSFFQLRMDVKCKDVLVGDLGQETLVFDVSYFGDEFEGNHPRGASGAGALTPHQFAIRFFDEAGAMLLGKRLEYPNGAEQEYLRKGQVQSFHTVLDPTDLKNASNASSVSLLFVFGMEQKTLSIAKRSN